MLQKSAQHIYLPVAPVTGYLIVKDPPPTPRNDKPKRKYPATTLLKRIPLHKLMDLKIDYAFKSLFGEEKNKQITVVFLNAILQKSGREPIKDITFGDTELHAEFKGDKSGRLDLFVTTESGEKINVEIQMVDQYNLIQRSIYYWSQIFERQLERGMDYKELRPVIAINIMNFKQFKETDRFHTIYHLREKEENFKLTDVMEFHFIEMPKLMKDWKEDKLDPWNDVLARWLLMLGMVDHRNEKAYEEIYRELEAIAMEDETLKAAFNNWEELSMDKKAYTAYEARLKYIIDEEAAIRAAELREIAAGEKGIEKGIEKGRKLGREEGREEGIEEGMEKGIEKGIEKTALRLLKDSVPIKKIIEYTQLTEEEIIELKNKL